MSGELGARPTLSIVVTTFQDANNLRLTLDSIAIQTGYSQSDVEVVVSDGGSTDETAEVIQNYESIVSRLRSSPDQGVYDGMNLGADLATGLWVQFLNAGDTFRDAGSLAILLRHLTHVPNHVTWVVAGAVHVDPTSGREVLIRNRPHRWSLHAFGLQPHCHQATWVRSDVHETLGGFRLDLDFVADHEMIMRLGAQSPPFEISEVLIAYQGGGMSEQRVDEIPRSLHVNRVRSLGWGPVRTALDWGFTILLSAYLRSRRTVGRILGR